MSVKIVRASPKDAFVLSVLTREYFDYADLNQAKILARLKSKDYEYWIAREAVGGKGKRASALAGYIDVDFTPIQGLRRDNAEESNAPEGNARGISVDAVSPESKALPSPTGLVLAAKARRKAKPKGTPKSSPRSQPAQAKILGLAVLPEFRGRGIAKRLIAKAVARAKARGCREIFLLVKEDNAVAQSLYGKLGFVRRGVLAEKLWGETILLYAKTFSKHF